MLHEIGSLMFVCIEEFISHQSMRVLVKTSEKIKPWKGGLNYFFVSFFEALTTNSIMNFIVGNLKFEVKIISSMDEL